MDDEDILHDLLEREGIAHYDGKQLNNSAQTIATQQVVTELQKNGLSEKQSVYKVQQVRDNINC